MKTKAEEIHAALNVIRDLCESSENCGQCALFNDTHKRCMLKIKNPSEWKINDPPAETWRAFK